MVWQIVNKVDTESAKKLPLPVRTPFLEMEGLRAPPSKSKEDSDLIEKKGINPECETTLMK